MNYASCSQCARLCEEGELLQREDDGRLVCSICSGLLTDEDLGCHYDESG